MLAAAAIIASTALPPSRKTASADCAARECGATAMPRRPRVGCAKLVLQGGAGPHSIRASRGVGNQLRASPHFDKLGRRPCAARTFPREEHMPSLLRFSPFIDALNEWIGKAVAWLGLAAVLICTATAVARYAFNIGSNAWLEIQWYLNSAVFLLIAAWALKRNEHVRIDVIAG